MQGKKAIIIFVPVPQLKAFQKIETRLVRELEKKFSGKHVVFIAQVCCTRCLHCTGLLRTSSLHRSVARYVSRDKYRDTYRVTSIAIHR